MALARKSFDLRTLGVATAGFCAFVNLYAPQSLLPELAAEFHVGPGAISALMTAGTLAIALTAPFTGALADVVGRKRLITAAMFAITVPTVIIAFAGSVPLAAAVKGLRCVLGRRLSDSCKGGIRGFRTVGRFATMRSACPTRLRPRTPPCFALIT